MASLLLCAPLAACAVLARPLLHPTALTLAAQAASPSVIARPTAVDEAIKAAAESQHQRSYRVMQDYHTYCWRTHTHPDAKVIKALSFAEIDGIPGHPLSPNVRRIIQRWDAAN